jgi:hypothetical protein
VNGVSSCCMYRWALDRISKLYDGWDALADQASAEPL